MSTIPQPAMAVNAIPGLRWTIVDADKSGVSFGSKIASFDSILSFTYTSQNDVLEYNIEKGQFATYNKQSKPAVLRAKLVKGGLTLPFLKKQFVDKLEEYKNFAKLVDFVTPFSSFDSYTIYGMSISNDNENNPSMLIVDLELKQVREIETLFSGLPADSDISDTKNLGNNQTV
jgi:hypothetical protein